MGNLKRYLLGIYHAVGVDKLARYLTAFAWRLNHWYDLLQVTQYGLSCTKAIRLLTLKSLRHMLCTQLGNPLGAAVSIISRTNTIQGVFTGKPALVLRIRPCRQLRQVSTTVC